MNCNFNECKWCDFDYSIDDYICMRPNFKYKEFEDNDNCEGFEQHKACDTCKHSNYVAYDTFEIDYFCKIQNNIRFLSINCSIPLNYREKQCSLWEELG